MRYLLHSLALAGLAITQASAGTFSFSAPLTDDASTGISPSRTYTHTISGGGAESVNGVVFELLDSTTTPANFDWVVSSVKNQLDDNNGGWNVAASGVTGPGLLGLLGSFTFNSDGLPGSTQTFTLMGLTPGTTYEARLYTRKWDDSTARGQTASFTAGTAPTDSITFFEDHAELAPIGQPNRESAWYLSYTYTADASGTLDIRFEIQASGAVQGDPGSFHMYALSNQVAGTLLDSDGDGLPNDWETTNGLNPADNGSVDPANGANGDPDTDGLNNSGEFAAGTNPKDNDTDDDGLQDGAEVTLTTNPLAADTDGDGLNDGDEVTRGTNPLLVDTDGDSYADGDEVSLGTNPLDPSISPQPSAFLVLHLKLDGETQDGSPLANVASLRGAPEFSNDIALGAGQAIAFSTNDMGVEVAAHESLASNAFTLTYWVKPTALQEGNGVERLTSRAGYAFETAIGNRAAVGGALDPLTLSYYQGTGWHSTGTGLPLNEYSHVAWRNRGSGPQELDLFVNGQLVFTGVGVPDGGPGDGLMSIGNGFNGVEGFEGLMDDVRLYRAPLKNSDIALIATPADSDGDGLPDFWEVQNGLNPADNGSVNPGNGGAGDPDSDGLPNSQEYARRTNPQNADTDDDGLLDGAEITRNTNPLVADTDGDGLADGDEVTRGTNPLVVDTDGDSIGDGDEVSVGTNPLDPFSGPPPSAFLVLHLTFDGNTQDTSPQANHGELLGAPEFVNDSPVTGGQALWFTSDDMGVQVPGSPPLASNTFTLSYWVKPTALQGGAGLERLTSRSTDRFETAIGDRNAVGGAPDPLTLSYYQGAWLSTGIALPLDEFSHVAWRNRGPGLQDLDLFVNGELRFTGQGVPLGSPGDGLMNIGTRHNGSEGFEGLMDDLRLYRAPLKDSDIAALVPPVTTVPFGIASIGRAPNGTSVTLTITSRPNRIYAVDYSTGLKAAGQPGGWIELTDALASEGAQTVFVDSQVSNLGEAFYRVRDVTP